MEHVAVFDFARAERKLERLAAAAKREKDVFIFRRPRHARGPGVSGEGRRDSRVVGRVEFGRRSFANLSIRACGEKGCAADASSSPGAHFLCLQNETGSPRPRWQMNSPRENK